MVGHSLLMLVTMDQSLRQSGLLRTLRMPMMRESMRSHPDQLRERGSGQEEESGDESLAERHAGIVTHPSPEVKPTLRRSHLLPLGGVAAGPAAQTER